MIRVFLVLLFASLTPFSLANAQSRDVYTVRGIAVDERATTLAEAQQKAFTAAKIVGAIELIDRITLPEDRRDVPGLFMTIELAELLSAAVDVEEETAGAGRYRGSLAVVFNPANVRAVLEQNNVPYIDQPAPKAVIIPVASFSREAAWNAAWDGESIGHLAPTVTSRSIGYSADSEWIDISGDVALYGAERGVIAQLLGSPGSYRVAVSTVTPSGVHELGTTARVGTVKDAAKVTADLLDDAWKQSSIIRETSRTLIEATVLYTSLTEWNTLRGALARSPLVSDFQTRAVSRDGAVVAFIFAGDGQRLTSDLRDRGVVIQMETIGWVLTSAITSVR